MPFHISPLKLPYPKWYNSNAHCDYHVGAPRYTTEDCTALKYKVRDLMKIVTLNFEFLNGPNVTKDPLPNHAGAK